MGARPIACLNLLRFGAPEHPKTRHLVAGVVAGIGGYGNSFGVPTVGGSVGFHTRYDGNILVNAMAVGVARADAIFYAKATGVGNPIVYLGSKTGRDGIHGATMASAAFEADAEEKRPTVQVGDPFAEKLLLEACLELMASGAVVAIQDMGAAGLTSSAVEMGAKGDLGVELDLDRVPCRETGMTAYEMMLSESQERMLMVLHPEKADAAEAIFRKWGLDFAVIGRTTDTKRFVVTPSRRGEGRSADQGARRRGAALRPAVDADAAAARARRAGELAPPMSTGDALLKLLGSPDLCSKRWVYEQYDSLILGNTVAGPRRRRGGGSARRRPQGPGADHRRHRALLRGRSGRGRQAGGRGGVAQSDRRRRAAAGADRQSQFRQSREAGSMGQLVGCLQGIGEAARALDFPDRLRQCLALQRDAWAPAFRRRPSIGGVGLVADVGKAASLAFRARGRGDPADRRGAGWLGQLALRSRSASAARTARRRRSISPPSAATASSSRR